MARAKDKSSLTGADNNLKCPICLEIYEEPVKITCGHSFCKDCIMGCLSKVSISQCPVCRTSFTTLQISDNTRLANLINTSSETCSKCNKLVKLSSFRDHKDTCTGTLDSKSRLIFTPVAPPSWPEPTSVTPNRSTFKCPYCYKTNLDREALIEHVSGNHSRDQQQVDGESYYVFMKKEGKLIKNYLLSFKRTESCCEKKKNKMFSRYNPADYYNSVQGKYYKKPTYCHRKAFDLCPAKVCPICASMPWGNPDQKSGNFQQHLSMRHQYEYDTFVDFNDEEDSTLQAVIERSKEEQ